MVMGLSVPIGSLTTLFLKYLKFESHSIYHMLLTYSTVFILV